MLYAVNVDNDTSRAVPALLFAIVRIPSNGAKAPLKTSDTYGTRGLPRNGFAGRACI